MPENEWIMNSAGVTVHVLFSQEFFDRIIQTFSPVPMKNKLFTHIKKRNKNTGPSLIFEQPAELILESPRMEEI